MIAKIAVASATFAIDKPYSYLVPENMNLLPGQRVLLPFGRANKRTEGIVLSVEPGLEENLKTVENCMDEEPILTGEQLRLAAFLRDRYFCTFYDAVHAILPAGIWFQTRETFSLTEDRSWTEKTIKNPDAQQLLQLLKIIHDIDLISSILVSSLRSTLLTNTEFIRTPILFKPKITQITNPTCNIWHFLIPLRKIVNYTLHGIKFRH